MSWIEQFNRTLELKKKGHTVIEALFTVFHWKQEMRANEYKVNISESMDKS